MQVMCNRKGGFVLRHPDGGKVKLVGGINTVDEGRFEEAMEAANPDWVEAICKAKANGQPADLVEFDGEAPAKAMNAKDKVELVKAAETMEDLDYLAEDEERATVLKAIEKRQAELQSE